MMKKILILLFALYSTQFHALCEEVQLDRILVLDIQASINPATLEYIKSGLDKARAENIPLILIKLNTPGGLITTTKDILSLMGDSNLPFAIWVGPKGASATSAGAIIASGASLLFMAPGTNIGAATPIKMSGDIQQKDVRSKAINDLVALVKSLSDSVGRNGKEFGMMISEASSLTSKEALKKKVINGILTDVNDLKDLVKNFNGQKIQLKNRQLTLRLEQSPQFVPLEMHLGQKFLNFFADPSVAYILFVLGALLIYFELQAAGGFIAGALGCMSLLLSGIGFQVLPLNYGAFGLILLSFILFVIEAYITSYGLLSIAGLASLLIGSLFLFRTPDSFIQLESSLIYSTVGAVGMFLFVLLVFLLKDFKRGPKQNVFSLVGQRGTVSSVSGDKLQIKVHGEIWNATYDPKLELGDAVQVVEQNAESMQLVVSKL